jgi:uncharacterized membrane protein
MKQRLLVIVIIALMIAAGALAWPLLPEIVPTRYGPDGAPNAYGPRWVAAFLMPVIAVVVAVLFSAAPRIDPLTRRDPQRFSYERFLPTLRRWELAILGFLLLAHLVQLAGALGWQGEPMRLVLGGMGLLFAVLGNEMGRLRPNSFAGIRVPWLMNDDAAWRRAHRWGGRWFVIGGVAAFFCALALPLAAASMAAIGCVVGATAATLIGSCVAALRTSQEA